MNLEDLFDGSKEVEVKLVGPSELFLTPGLYCVFTQHSGLMSVFIHNMRCWSPTVEQACEVVQFAAEYFKDEKTLFDTFPHESKDALRMAICKKLGLDFNYAWIAMVRELTDKEWEQQYGSEEEE